MYFLVLINVLINKYFFYYVNLKFSQISKCCTVIDYLFDINNEKNLNFNDSNKLHKKEIGFKIMNYRIERKKIVKFSKIDVNHTNNLKEINHKFQKEKSKTLKLTFCDYIDILL
jgi:hypothetical protein